MVNVRRVGVNRVALVWLLLGMPAGFFPWAKCAHAAAPASFLEAMHAPSGLRPSAQARPITLAIVDDGLRVSHQDLRPFLWPNPREIAGNRIDDDGNGRVDDLVGWDVSDDDDDVNPPAGREDMFYHGTHLAGIVAQILRHAYGAEASKLVRILPVKCLADNADRPYLKDGYKGIQYAVDAGADIILAAWGEAYPSPAKLKVLQSAQERGVLVVASAGNTPSEKDQFPAALPSVLAVSAVDATGGKYKEANFGNFIDLMAPGVEIVSASAASDTAQASRSGTSMATAIVAASVAILKLQRPELSRDELLACLKNTAEPVERFQRGEIFYGGKLGAGRVNLAAAVAYPLPQEPLTENLDRRGHQGYLASFRRPAAAATWRIRPEGKIKGFWFEPKKLVQATGGGRFSFYAGDPAAGDSPMLQLDLSTWKEKRFVPGQQIVVAFDPGPAQAGGPFMIEYASESIDQSTLYCRDTQAVKTAGIIEDGSGPEDYSPRSSCQWQITAPAGKVIHVRFLEFDTEANTDWLYFFNGTGTNDTIMAAYSGPRIPPELTTWGQQALLWFVTNDSKQGRGWKAEVSFRDPPAAPANRK